MRHSMRSIAPALLAILGGVAPGLATSQDGPIESQLDADSVKATIVRVADWQLEERIARDPRHWSMAALYDGLIDTSLVTGDARYLAAVLRAGMRVDFHLGSRTYHADGHAAGHAWLRIYLMDPERDPKFLDPFIEQFDEIVDHPIMDDLSFEEDPPEGLFRTDRWTWADALYMSPPTMTLLAEATADDRYLEFIDREFWLSYEALFDPEAGLFYRDETYIDQRTPNGEKVFWSRGNAWVYAGLALMLDSLREDYPTRPLYIQLFQQMSESLLAAQGPGGFWTPSLLDPAHVPIGETSGTALFVLGMAWGVRNGLLDAATYWPAVELGWNALGTSVNAHGAVSFVQPFGEAPEVFDPTSRVPYGTGAVLMAGAEILRGLNAAASVDPAALLSEAQALVPTTGDLSSECDEPCTTP